MNKEHLEDQSGSLQESDDEEHFEGEEEAEITESDAVRIKAEIKAHNIASQRYQNELMEKEQRKELLSKS